MNLSPQEALKSAKLEPGLSSFRVNGWQVELRVEPVVEAEPESLLDESGVMLEPWIELPPLGPGTCIPLKQGKLPPPELLEIPADEDER
jgi:hypothetical protein